MTPRITLYLSKSPNTILCSLIRASFQQRGFFASDNVSSANIK